MKVIFELKEPKNLPYHNVSWRKPVTSQEVIDVMSKDGWTYELPLGCYYFTKDVDQFPMVGQRLSYNDIYYIVKWTSYALTIDDDNYFAQHRVIMAYQEGEEWSQF
tara:strand:+ start:746 stop:1063 length:318 start_codon:yes stop_codon:yes gene_type:complete